MKSKHPLAELGGFMVAKELTVDVSRLEPPEPLMVVLEAIDKLGPGEYVHVLHRQDPHLLYSHLLEQRMRYRWIDGDRAPFELLIWRDGDPVAESVCAAYPGQELRK